MEDPLHVYIHKKTLAHSPNRRNSKKTAKSLRPYTLPEALSYFHPRSGLSFCQPKKTHLCGGSILQPEFSKSKPSLPPTSWFLQSSSGGPVPGFKVIISVSLNNGTKE